MSTVNKVIIFLHFPILDKTVECSFSMEDSFRTNMEKLWLLMEKEDGQYYRFSGKERVFEKETMAEYDMTVPLSLLNIKNSMSFLVY